MNPEWEVLFSDDVEIASFVESNFDSDVITAFNILPLGVMRADFWRYLVLYKFGGCYTDIDTRCIIPIDQWLPVDTKLLIATENDVHFCQWTILSEPGHPILERAIQLVTSRALSGITLSPNFVHHYTGPGVFTDAVRETLGLGCLSPFEIQNQLSNADNMKNKFDKFDVSLFPNRLFNGEYVEHHFGSLTWSRDEYKSWQLESDEICLPRSSSQLCLKQ